MSIKILFFQNKNVYKPKSGKPGKEAKKIANQQLVDYIKNNSGNYPIEQLKSFLIQKGYPKADVDEAAAQATGKASKMPPIESPGVSQSQDTTKACIAYLLTWLTGLIVFFISDKNDKYTRFHAMQAIFLGIGMFVFYYGLSMIMVPLLFVGGSFLFVLLTPVIWLAFIALIIFMMVSAYKGKKTKLPVIGNIAERIVEKS